MARIGGTISATNRAEGGAILKLTFPIAKAPPMQEMRYSSADIQRLSVMVIDDDHDNLDAFSALLETKGHSVKRASSGLEALQKLAEENVMADVVFCDLGMPLMNGWEIARRVKSLKTAPAFFLVTGWASEIPDDDPRRRLVDAIIAKPVDPAIVDRLLVEHAPTAFHSASRMEADRTRVYTSAACEH
jgi:CheY-like chemotaxis protein